jgi:hypothetical protein
LEERATQDHREILGIPQEVAAGSGLARCHSTLQGHTHCSGLIRVAPRRVLAEADMVTRRERNLSPLDSGACRKIFRSQHIERHLPERAACHVVGQ